MKNPYQRYSSNPLSRFDKIGYLDDHAHGIINRTYMIRFLTKEKDMPANMSEIEWAKVKTEFEEFKQRFDLEAIGKSIEHMEDNYHRHFYRNYWTNARYQTLQKQMELLDAVNTDGVEEMIYPFEDATTYLREDVVNHVITQQEAVENVEKNLEGHFVLPKVVK